MNIRTELCKEQSTSQRLRIVDFILENNAEFAQLMAIFLSENLRLQQRSAWIVGRICIKNPELLKPFYRPILERLPLPETSDTFKRNVVRVWQEVDLPEQFFGEIYDLCLRFLSGKEAIAIKAFSMTVCYNISQKFPELKPELLATLEDVLMKDGQNSKGILSRGNKTLKMLKKDLNMLYFTTK